jgi:hypothetical protein
MRRTFMAVLAALALVAVFAAPVGAKEFGLLYADGELFRTFGNPARVDQGTATDPIYTFENSTNPDQLSVARFAPGEGSHGGRWAVYHVTFTDPTAASLLITDADQIDLLEDEGRVTIARDEGADFRCPILPNG